MLKSLALAALLSASSVIATKCDADNKCPKDKPCCSQYGECGVGAFCLGGCDPTQSYSLDACVPAPVCKDLNLKLDSTKNIVDIGDYLGDPDDGDWVASGEPAIHNGNTLLTMPKGSVGTVMSTTTYLWYGNVKARMKTSRGKGVVTAFILFSDVKDEIDYEFVGVDLEQAQSNYYFQGITNYTNSENLTISDSFQNFHDYEIKWTPDQVEWLIDGDSRRTLKRDDTWNETSSQYEYPQTPARVQLSLWPGGLATNPKGTVDWAGGVIDWDAEDIKKTGYFYAEIESVQVECYNGKDGLGTNSGKSYYYDNIAGTNDTVVDGDKDTVLGSLQATGLNMNKGKKDDGKDKSKDDKKDKSDDSENTPTVPGGSTGTGNDHSDGESSNTDNSGSSDGSTNAKPDSGTFDQGLQDNTDGSGSGGSGGGNAGTKSSASALAMIIAGAALFWL